MTTYGERTAKDERWAVAGPLWLEEWDGGGLDEQKSNGHSLITPVRWLWWAERLDELAESNTIDDESKAMAMSSAHKMRRLQEDRV